MPAPPPAADSPAGVVQRLKWCWENRDPGRYSQLFTADFRYTFLPNDSSGDAFRLSPWTQLDEYLSAYHLFKSGVAGSPPASAITLAFSGDIVTQSDYRPGKIFPWHQSVALEFTTLLVTLADGESFRAVGSQGFTVVRGDSARLPQYLIDSGLGDAHHWFIDSWWQYGGYLLAPASRNGPAQASDAALVTWGWLKTHYLQ